MWRDVTILKKTKEVLIDQANTTIDLRDYTKGVSWKNSNNIIGINQINPKNGILKLGVINNKIDDNLYKIHLEGSTYEVVSQKNVLSLGYNNESKTFNLSNVKHCYFIVNITGGGIFRYPYTATGILRIIINGKIMTEISVFCGHKGAGCKINQGRGSYIYKGLTHVVTNDIAEVNFNELIYISMNQFDNLEIRLDTSWNGSGVIPCKVDITQIEYSKAKPLPSKDERATAIFYEQTTV